MSARPFFDTNILIYAFTEDDPRGDAARNLIAEGGTISVQVLNELTSVLRVKFKLNWKEVTEALTAVRDLCPLVAALTLHIHENALRIAQRYGYRIYDCSIIAAALDANSKVLFSEDMTDGQVIDDSLLITNPFRRSK